MSTRTKSVTVLIVEDDALVRLFAAHVIAAEGFMVFEATDADGAIATLEKHPEIQIVFTDVEMPGSMDGIKLAHYIRHRWPPVQLIVVSGRVDFGNQELPDATVAISKPYTPDQIAGRLREVAARLPSPD